jgi:hypothetical protein
VSKLIEELELRGIRADRDGIALVSEWDTFHGRALPITLAAQIQVRLRAASCEQAVA